MVRIHCVPPTALNLINASNHDSQSSHTVVRVHCFPLQQQNQQMQALKASYSFNIAIRIQFPPKQELLEKKIFLIPKTVPMTSS